MVIVYYKAKLKLYRRVFCLHFVAALLRMRRQENRAVAILDVYFCLEAQ